MLGEKRICVVIPALNEENSIALVVSELLALTNLRLQPLIDQVVVCNNGSTDQTENRAIEAGAKVVRELVPGYGRACQAAIAALDRPDIVLFIDGDYSAITQEVECLLEPILEGADLVIGSRVLGHAQTGAMTLPQRVGNWLAVRMIYWFWRFKVSDLGPFRAIRSDALERLQMRDEAFGWTVEMQIKAIQCSLNMVEVPVNTRCRIGKSKISGSLKGVVGAAIGIIGTIIKFRLLQRRKRNLKEYAVPGTTTEEGNINQRHNFLSVVTVKENKL